MTEFLRISKVKVETYHIFQLLSKLRIITYLELTEQKWLEATFSPDFRNKVMTSSQYLCHRPRAPMGCIGWLLRHCFRNDLLTNSRLCLTIFTSVVIASRNVLFYA